MQPDEADERAACAGSEPLLRRANRYMREALGIQVDPREFSAGSVLEYLHAQVLDYLNDRRRLCKRIAAERSEGGHIMRSLRTDPLIPFHKDGVYNPIGRRSEFSLAAELEALEQTERRLSALAAAWMNDNRGE